MPHLVSKVNENVMVHYLENTLTNPVFSCGMYSTNKHLPRIRRDVAIFAKKYGIRKASRHFGYAPSAISKWVKILEKRGHHPILTESSRPRNNPHTTDEKIVERIVDIRMELRRSAEVVHETLKREGVTTSLSTVKRTLARKNLLNKRSPWKRFHPHVERPYPQKPGDLVQIDTIHTIQGKKERMYTFVLIDVYSRWVYAKSYQRMSAKTALLFVAEAQEKASFHFDMLQSDHGPEFGSWFVSQVRKKHRYTRIGKPNDNSHVERVNRTLQEECLDRLVPTPRRFNKALKEYLKYYNTKRFHFGINLKTPEEILKCSQGID
jgi:putative transposase